jgi:nucleoside-diphosphate-sugar epimerase
VVPGKSMPLLGLMRALKRGRLVRFGRGPAVFNYVAVEDVAAAVLHAVVTPVHGRTWIVNTPALVDNALGWISDELGIEAPVRRLPEAFGEIAVRLAAPLAALARRSPPIDRARLRELTNTTRYDGAAICHDSGFSYPVGAERLLRSLAARYRDEDRL